MSAEEEVARLTLEWRTGIASQLNRIEGNMGRLEDRLRVIEIGLVQKGDIKELDARLRVIENFKLKALGFLTAVLLVAELIKFWIEHAIK